VVDLGCGTGVLARRLAARGITVTGIDPAAGSIAYAREQPGADRVRWILGDATAIPGGVDLVLMTGNAAQAIVEPTAWDATLDAVPPGARFVFETRDPARRAWEGWTKAQTHREAGPVTTWTELTGVDLPLVGFRTTFEFPDDVLTSDSTLRFRERDEVEADLRRHGFTVEDVRDAPDRPGLEFVFVAGRLDL
jgi:SAM-dependent methyltransferase